MTIFNSIIDVIYGTKRAVHKFKQAYPNDTVVAASGTKAIKTTPKDEVDTGAKIVCRNQTGVDMNDDGDFHTQA